MISKQPRKQRKAQYQAPLHKRQKFMGTHLSGSLREKYGRRTFGVRSGDTVKIMRGEYAGTEGKVEQVNLKKGTLAIDGATLFRADGEEVPRPIYPSNVMITKLDLDDEIREQLLSMGD
ncbi:MAG: 50S ribosomal protein L24 [Euryarchaeota archaeon]|nr:50S ribosomal protein L24 [Euryarchaeota archaeon]